MCSFSIIVVSAAVTKFECWPFTSIEDAPFRWFVGLDQTGTRIGNALWRGTPLKPLIERARIQPKRRLVFTDGSSPHIQRAAQILVDEGICTPILLGDPKYIHAEARHSHIKLDGMELEPVINGTHAARLADALWKLRGRKGMTFDRWDDLERFYEHISRFDPEMLVQEYIPGTDEDLAIFGSYLGRGGGRLGRFVPP